jgi:hypothetical protein
MCPILVGSLTISGSAHLIYDYWISKLVQKWSAYIIGEKYLMCFIDITICHFLNISYFVLLIDVVL